LGGGILLTIFLNIAFSCKKEIEAKNEPSDIIAAKNQLLINEFLEPGLSDRSGLNSGSLWNGMLFFNDSTEIRLYLNALDSLQANWDYSNESFYESQPSWENHLGDAALTAIETVKGFSSLRVKYELLRRQNMDFEKNLPFYIGDPEFQCILNDKNEIRIGNNIYKYVSESIVAIVPIENTVILSRLRENGINTWGTNFHFYDEESEQTITPISEITYRGCGGEWPAGNIGFFTIPEITQNVGGDFRAIELFVNLLFDPIQGGASKILIEWGDGFTSEAAWPYIIDDVKFPHTYNTNLAAGSCKEFTIKYTATTTIASSGCPIGTTFTRTKKVNICNSLPGCTSTNHVRLPKASKQFTFEGKNYLLIGEIGQKPKAFLNSNKKIWATSHLYKKNSNGEWKDATPKFNLGAAVFGWHITNSCTTKSIYWHHVDWQKDCDVTIKKKINEDFGTLMQNNGENVFGHFMCQMEPTGIPFDNYSIFSFSLWP
jgi:hypothetical protein